MFVFVIQINYTSSLRHVGDHKGNGFHEGARGRERSHEQWRGGSHGYLGRSGHADLSGHWPGARPVSWPEGTGRWPGGVPGHWSGGGHWPGGDRGRWSGGEPGRWPGGEPGRWPGGWPGRWIGRAPLQGNDGGYYKNIDIEYEQGDERYEEACRLACLPGIYVGGHNDKIIGNSQDHFGRHHFKYSCRCYVRIPMFIR